MSKKRILTMLLALILVFSLTMPMTALADSYTVTFDPNGGTFMDDSSTDSRRVSVEAGHTVTEPAVLSETGVLENWQQVFEVDGKEGSSKFDFSTPIDSDTNLRASWTAATAESVGLDGTLDLTIGETRTLTATVAPSSLGVDAWTSSDPSVATVDKNGLVTAVASGAANITVWAGGCTAVCTVTVTAPPVAVAEAFNADPLDGGQSLGTFSTLYAAIHAEGVTYVRLLEDVEEHELSCGSLTLDLNGYHIDGGNSWVLYSGGGALTITGPGYITSSYPRDDSKNTEGAIGKANGTLTINGGAEIRNTSAAGIAIDGFGCSIVLDNGSICAAGKMIQGFAGQSVEISSGTFNASSFIVASPLWGSGTGFAAITITGGSFYGGTGGFVIDTADRTINGVPVAEGYEIVADTALSEGWYKVQPHVHIMPSGTEPSWQWKVINGQWAVKATYTFVCTTCGETVTETVDAEVTGPVETESAYIYTATTLDDYAKTSTYTLAKSFTVTYNGSSSTFTYGQVCRLTAPNNEASDWYVSSDAGTTRVKRAGNAPVFYLPVTGNVTVGCEFTEDPQPAVSAVLTADSLAAGSLTYKFVWSVPEGAQVTSAMIYRCRDDDSSVTTAGALLDSSVLRSYDTRMNVRNGEFTYTAKNLTSGTKQTIMFRLAYTRDGVEQTPLDTEIRHITIS